MVQFLCCAFALQTQLVHRAQRWPTGHLQWNTVLVENINSARKFNIFYMLRLCRDLFFWIFVCRTCNLIYGIPYECRGWTNKWSEGRFQIKCFPCMGSCKTTRNFLCSSLFPVWWPYKSNFLGFHLLFRHKRGKNNQVPARYFSCPRTIYNYLWCNFIRKKKN